MGLTYCLLGIVYGLPRYWCLRNADTVIIIVIVIFEFLNCFFFFFFCQNLSYSYILYCSWSVFNTTCLQAILSQYLRTSLLRFCFQIVYFEISRGWWEEGQRLCRREARQRWRKWKQRWHTRATQTRWGDAIFRGQRSVVTSTVSSPVSCLCIFIDLAIVSWKVYINRKDGDDG